jgi:8-oxo-dGTP pyrophosphatase MutT (NUDIX family)
VARPRLVRVLILGRMHPHQLALLELLEAHVPADAIERGHLQELIDLVRRDPRCFARDSFTPGHITGSAFVVDHARGLLLLHHHRKLDRWLQLGGHDNGEQDVLQTALREAREESGLSRIDLPPGPPRILDVDVHTIPARKEDPAHRHLDVRFLFLADATQPLSMDAAESRALAWVPLADAAERMGELGAVRVVNKLTAALAN